MQHNVAGHTIYKGDTQAARDTLPQILSHQAEVVTLNEICQQQAAALDAALTDTGYPMTMVHTKTIPNSFTTQNGFRCDFGNALFVKGNGSIVSAPCPNGGTPAVKCEHPLEETPGTPVGGRRCHLTCVLAALPAGLVRVCVTHLVNGTSSAQLLNRQIQVGEVATYSIRTSQLARRSPSAAIST